MAYSDNDTQENEIDQIQSVDVSSDITPSQEGVAQRPPYVSYEETYFGPIPDPKTLEQYDAVLPGAADRILSMAERQATHRQSLETATEAGVRTEMEDESKRANLGLWLGVIACVFLIACGTFLVYNGHDWAGTTMIVATIVGIVGTFVWGSRTGKNERLEVIQLLGSPSEHSDDD